MKPGLFKNAILKTTRLYIIYVIYMCTQGIYKPYKKKSLLINKIQPK